MWQAVLFTIWFFPVSDDCKSHCSEHLCPLNFICFFLKKDLFGRDSRQEMTYNVQSLPKRERVLQICWYRTQLTSTSEIALTGPFLFQSSKLFSLFFFCISDRVTWCKFTWHKRMYGEEPSYHPCPSASPHWDGLRPSLQGDRESDRVGASGRGMGGEG